MSELKRVAFTTITNSIGGSGTGVGATTATGDDVISSNNGAGGGNGNGGSTNSISSENNISNNLKKGTNFNSNTITAALHQVVNEVNHNENASSSSYSTAMPPPSSSSVVGGFASSSSALATVPLDSMTSRQGSSLTSSSKTIRLDLQLFEPDSNSSPEFNYLELIKIEKKKLKKLSRINGFSDPFEENHDEIARIAKEFEKKYGSGVVGSGKRRSKKDDWYDKGAGYDESDSFIDNTEAYDEIIPDEIETVEGGFYINSGALEFKHLSNYDKTEEVIKMNNKTTRKRTLSTSSSSSDEDEDENDSNEAEEETEAGGGNSSPKESLTSSNNNNNTAHHHHRHHHKLKNGHLDKKQKSSGGEASDKESSVKSSSSSSLLSKHSNKDRRSDNNNSSKPKDDVKIDEIYVDSIKEKDKEKTVKTTTVKDMLKAKRDNFRKMQEGESKLKLINGSESLKIGSSSGGGSSAAASNESSDTSEDDSDDSNDEPSEKRIRKNSDDDTEKIRVNDVKLPDTLSKELIKDIEEMKEIGKSQIQFSKGFQFDDKVTEVFLRIDDALLCLDKSTRNLVLAHIEYQLSLPKYYLLRKAKQLRIKQEKTKTKKAFAKLKKAVLERMPSILLQYEGNYKKIEEIRASIPSGELEQMEHPPKYPKKKFPWDETLRNLLYDLYQVRWTSYTVLRTRKETFEDFVNTYLREKVVSIWPSGWMSYENLKKELERRKLQAKKQKDGKRTVVVDLTSTPHKSSVTSVDGTAPSSSMLADGKSLSSQPLELISKSALSTSTSLSVVSTKDLVVTIATTKSSEKLSSTSTEVPCSTSTQSKSLSTTQVPADSINLQSSIYPKGSTGKDISPTSSHHQHKSSKSVSGSNNNSGSSKSPSPSHLDHNHMSATSSKLSSQNHSSSNNYSKGNNTNNSNNNNNINSHHKMPSLSSSPTGQSTTTNTNKGPIDLVSPTKRSTDHSISSIISSSASSQSLITTNKTPSSPPSAETATTHIITVDNLKSTTEIINTTNKLLNNSGGGNGTNSTAPAAAAATTNSSNSNSKEGSIRIRSFANVNTNVNEIDEIKEVKSSNCSGGFLQRELKIQDQDSSSESDGVEIVGVYPATTKKQTTSTVNTKSNNNNKNHKKNSKKSSRSDSPVNPTSTGYTAVQNVGKMSTKTPSSEDSAKDSELDVHQIMKVLKELEVMQQSSINLANSSPPTTTSSSVNNRPSSNPSSSSSPTSFGKDIKP